MANYGVVVGFGWRKIFHTLSSQEIIKIEFGQNDEYVQEHSTISIKRRKKREDEKRLREWVREGEKWKRKRECCQSQSRIFEHLCRSPICICQLSIRSK